MNQNSKKIPLLVFVVFLALFLSVNLSAKPANDYCKYSDDPIFIDENNPRHFLDLSDSMNQLTFCNLRVGETYAVCGISELNPNCGFQFGFSGKSQFLTIPADQYSAEINAALQTHFKFVAETKCMDFIVSANNCVNSNQYSLIVSIANLTAQPNETAAINGFLPILQVNPNVSAEKLISDIFIGSFYDVSNVNAIGSSQGSGFFGSGSSSVMMQSGVVFSTGLVVSAPGPCNGTGSSSNGGGGDIDLEQLAGINVADVSGVEFDFIPVGDQLTFNYVFASEEYCEWVGQYNDAFGFFISGPGINGPYSGGAENIAIIPNSGGTNVAINTVNHQTNTQYFNPNAANCNGITNCPDIRYDGYTDVFQAIAQNLVPCETYHIKLVVGDANDQIIDSAVFLGGGSFDAGCNFYAKGDVLGGNANIVSEACQDGQFVFTRNAMYLSEPLVIDFNIGGTATPDEDYVPFSTSITFSAGQSEFFLDVDILSDTISEDQETITIFMNQNACSCSEQTAEIIIKDYLPLEAVDQDFAVCGLQNTTLYAMISGGAPIYTYLWSNNQTGPSIIVDSASTTTYVVTVTDDCGETIEKSVTINFLDSTNITTAVIYGNSAFCIEDPNPSAILTVAFTGPGPWDLVYSFNGQPQTPFLGITENPFEFLVTEPGIYRLSSVENAACLATVSGSATIAEVDIELTIVSQNDFCFGETNGSLDLTVISGSSPFTYQWNNAPPIEDPINLGSGTYSVTVTDNNGCTAIDSITINEPAMLTLTIDSVGNETESMMNGFINITPGGGVPPYAFSWSNGAGVISTDEDPSGLSAGSYEVEITDANGCVVVLTDIVVDNIVGISQIQLNNAIKVYPNPTSGLVYIKFDLYEAAAASVLGIYDFTGRLIEFKEILDVFNQSILFDLSGFSDGVYTLKVKVDDTFTVKKIVKYR